MKEVKLTSIEPSFAFDPSKWTLTVHFVETESKQDLRISNVDTYLSILWDTESHAIVGIRFPNAKTLFTPLLRIVGDPSKRILLKHLVDRAENIGTHAGGMSAGFAFDLAKSISGAYEISDTVCQEILRSYEKERSAV